MQIAVVQGLRQIAVMSGLSKAAIQLKLDEMILEFSLATKREFFYEVWLDVCYNIEQKAITCAQIDKGHLTEGKNNWMIEVKRGTCTAKWGQV